MTDNIEQDPKPFQQHSRLWMAVLLLAADALSLFLAGLGAVALRMVLPGNLENPPFYWTFVPFITVFVAVFALRGLYPAIGLSPVEELRRLSVSTSVVFLILTGFTFWARTAELYSRLVFAYSWLLALAIVPLGRMLLRLVASRLGLWGEPVAVIGLPAQAGRLADYLNGRIRLGLRPAALIAIDSQPGEPPMHPAGLYTAIVVLDGLPESRQRSVITHEAAAYRRLILITDLSWTGSLGLTPYDLEGLLGLEVRQNLLQPLQKNIKRLSDLLLGLFFGLITLPLTVLIAVLVRLESPGSALYRHSRLGRNGKEIHVWKFRTMPLGADTILAAHLAANAQAQAEWQATHKLRRDPRLTRLGRVLRRTSLDELPQLWNVMRGEMSLVGPRPIVPAEIAHYQDGYQLYQSVQPGITGLWQVSGRNDTSYAERVQLDEYYIRNWSLWLDVYILLRTAYVVLRGEGAY